MPIVEVTNGWQDWIINDGVVSEGNDGSFTFKCAAPASGSPVGQQPMTLQTLPATASSGSQIYIAPPTSDLIEELLAAQHALPC